MSNRIIGPVEQFYIDIEIKRIEAEKALLEEQGPAKPKRGRPRKNKLYFTVDTENAIIAYNIETSQHLRNKVFNEYIYNPLFKMTQSLIHRYKFYHFDSRTTDVQNEVIAFILEKLPKYTQEKGRAFSYFSIVAKNYLIQNNYKHYNRKKSKAPVISIDSQRDVTNEIIRGEQKSEIQDFYHQWIDHCDHNMDKIIRYKRDMPIAYAILEIFRNCENIETYNKKALYIMVREMVDVKTQYITRVVNILKKEYLRLFKIYQEKRTVN
jgi:hypothetical protein